MYLNRLIHNSECMRSLYILQKIITIFLLKKKYIQQRKRQKNVLMN